MGTKIELEAGFDCDFSAMDSEQRHRHSRLVRELFSGIHGLHETPTGFLFEFARSDEQLLKIAEWTTLESRCCPFFRFRIDLRPRSELLQVTVTGPSGSKELIRGYLKEMSTREA